MNKNKWKHYCLGIMGVCLLLSCQKSPAFDVDKSLDYCVTQVERSLNQLKPYDYSRVPRNILSGEQHWNLRPVAIEEWCAGFWPGVLWYTYEYAQDSVILEQARNLCIDYNRRFFKKLEVCKNVLDESEELSCTTEDCVAYNELLQLEQKAIEQLPTQRKKVYQLSMHGDYSYREMAENLQISPRTVEKHLLMGRNHVRSYIAACI